MSKWQDIPKEDISIDGEDIDICIGGDDCGNNYCTVKKSDMLDLLGVKKLIERIEELEDKNQLLTDLNESLTERINNVEVLERENRFLHECTIPQLIDDLSVEWSSTTDKLPEKEGEYLAYIGKQVIIAKFDGIDYWSYAYFANGVSPLYWMPLPEPPK